MAVFLFETHHIIAQREDHLASTGDALVGVRNFLFQRGDEFLAFTDLLLQQRQLLYRSGFVAAGIFEAAVVVIDFRHQFSPLIL